MPTSHFRQIPDIIEAAIVVAPRSVLEVGVGCGKYGALLREYLTVWDHYFEPWGSVPLRMVGVEVHPLYADSSAWACYDAVIVADVREVNLPELGHFDMSLMVDVLEHFEHQEGEALISRLLDVSDALLIGVPGAFCKTVEVWDNPHEVHKADWTAVHLRNLGYEVEVRRNDDARVMVVRRP